MDSVGSDQHAWQRSHQHARVLYFCIFAVLLLVTLCCCQLRSLGLDFVSIHPYFRKQPRLQKSKASLWRGYLKVLVFVLSRFLTCKSPFWTRMQLISHSSCLVIFPAPMWNAATWLCVESSADVPVLYGWLAEQPPGEGPSMSASTDKDNRVSGTMACCCYVDGSVSPANVSKPK